MFSTAITSVSALLVSNSVDAGMVGLMMTYTLSVTGVLVSRLAYTAVPKTNEAELAGQVRI